MLVVGTIGVVSGTALHFHHIHKLNTAPTPTWGTADRFAELAGNAPRVQAGVAVLISTGITLFVAGIVLCAIKEQRRVAYDPSLLAGFRF